MLCRSRVREGAVIAAALVAACSGYRSSGDAVDAATSDAGEDATPDADAGADAIAPRTTCAWDAPFTKVHAVDGVNEPTGITGDGGTGAVAVAAPSLSKDERTLYYQIRSGQNYRLYRGERADLASPFTNIVPLVELSPGTSNDNNITVSPDGLLAVFASDRVVGGDAGAGTNLWSARRTTITASWEPPTLITNLGVPRALVTAFITLDGDELWFSALDPNGIDHATYITGVGATGFAQASARADVSGWAPVLSEDKLTIYYAVGTNSVTNNVRVAHRDGALGAFTPGSLVGEVNEGGETPGWLSPDQCRLYFTTRRTPQPEIWVAERTP